MNYLKKKLKPLTSGLSSVTSNITSSHSHQNNRHDKDEDLENDLYDDQVIDVPPHPSELLALGIDPTDIDVNDPDKLRELYRKAKEEGNDKKTNSVLLAKQRQKEEIEEKKKTKEEWKFFDSITARVEQAVKESQKTLEHLKESSAIETLAEPNYELRLTPDQVFKPAAAIKQERSAENWIDFNEGECDEASIIKLEENISRSKVPQEKQGEAISVLGNQHLLDDLLKDTNPSSSPSSPTRERNIKSELPTEEVDPFDTSFVLGAIEKQESVLKETSHSREQAVAKSVDPFDTSYVNL